MSAQYQLDILGDNAIPVNQDFVITLTKENSDSIDHETKRKCKILNLSSEFSFNEILLTILRLESKSYPNLFIFVFKDINFGFSGSNLKENPEKVEILMKALLEFDKNRPIIVQLTSKAEHVTRMYYKEQNSSDFLEMKEQIEKKEDFSSFLWFYFNNSAENFEDVMVKKLPKVKNSSLVLRFLRALNLLDDSWVNLVVKCAETGSQFDLLAAIDAPLDDEVKEQVLDPENFLSWMIDTTSVLHIALQNSNQEVIDLLVTKCPNLIQQLPFEHQIQISTTAFSTNQLVVLCDLLKLADFPFPSSSIAELVLNEKLRKIIDGRIKFHENILTENLNEIEKFSDENRNIKFAYNLQNKSAISCALDSKKFKAFFLLQSLRYEDNEIDNYGEKLSDVEDKRAASKFAAMQRRENVNISVPCEERTIQLMSMSSFVYDRNNRNESKRGQHEKIKEWYKDIYMTKFGPKLLDAAAQCENLKIIFDFECDSVSNVDLPPVSGVLGSTNPVSKFIFVGAKLSGEKEREQQVKGVLAHEICHYVMRLVYQNGCSPYYKSDEGAAKKFYEIIFDIKQMLFSKKIKQVEVEMREEQSTDNVRNKENEKEDKVQGNDEDVSEEEEIDDGCDGIISTVYSCYPEKGWIAELIVRPFHIQAQFDDDQKKLTKLEEKYKNLFEFCENFVILELGNFNLTERKEIQNFNDLTGVLSELKESGHKFCEVRDVSDLISNQLVIVTSNVPKLLLLNIYEHLNRKYESEMTSIQNIFMNARTSENSHILKMFQEAAKTAHSINFFIDCSRGFGKITEIINSVSESKSFLLIVSNEKQCEELRTKLQKKKLNPTKMTINYNWMDLTSESQNDLLQNRLTFQNNSKFSLFELTGNEKDPQNQQSSINDDFKEVIDVPLLKSLLEKEEIQINARIEEQTSEKTFRIIFQMRNLIKKKIVIKEVEESDDEEPDKMNTAKRRKTFIEKMSNLSRFISKKITKSFGKESSTQIQPKMDPGPARYQKYVEEIIKSEEISQEKMLEDVKDQKFVLISDIAGSGKSWMMKNFTNKIRELHPKKWTTYVDLKQFIDEFKSQDTQREFSIFMAEKILKLKAKFEAEIFKKLYKIGKVCILFDGFDEIAPDCAEIVSKLFQSFQQNGGNQLWIATRDYFEVSLKKDLNIDVVYKLDEFTEQHGIELIITSWILHDIKSKIDDQLENDLRNDIKSSPNYENYKDSATEISKTVTEQKADSIGLPQFYKMIADISKDKKDSIIEMTLLIIFEECVDIQYTRWSREKGKLRETANKESQHKDANYHRLHELIAMESLFPFESKFCDLKREYLVEWPEEEIIACGLLSKKGEKFFFPHETFREFYAEKFVIRNLTRGDMDVMKYFIEFLTVEKFGIIRMFLNEAFGKKSVLEKVEDQMSTNAKKIWTHIKNIENLSLIFKEELENLTYFVIKVFGANKNYKQVKLIFFENSNILMSATRNKSLFINIQDFIFEYLSVKDLKKLLLKSKILVTIFGSQLEAEDISQIIKKFECKTDFEFISTELQMEGRGGNSLFHLIKSDHHDENACKLEECFDIINKYLSEEEIIKLAKERDYVGENILHVCAKTGNKIKLQFVWNKYDQIFKFQNIHHEFKEIFSQKASENERTVIHYGANCDKLEFHEILWALLLKTFENRKELKDLILQGDRLGNIFVHSIIENKSEIVEFTLNKIKEVFSAEQYQEIIYSKGFWDQNLLQIAAIRSKSIETHQILWKTFRNLCESNEEFLEFLKQRDSWNNNIFHIATSKSTSEIFEFMINQLEELTVRDEIRKLLNAEDFESQNLLQLAAKENKSFEFHERLWKITRKYFDPSEIWDTVMNTGWDGKILLQLAVEKNTKEVAELTYNEIKKSLIVDDESDSILLELRNECYKSLLILLEDHSDNTADKFDKKLRQFDSYKLFKKVLNQEISIKDSKILLGLATCDKVEFHETLWEKILKNYENKEELKDLILQEDKAGNNFVHLVTLNENSEVVDLTSKKVKEMFSDVEYEEILRSRGCRNRNLVQSAARGSKNVELSNCMENLKKFLQTRH